MFQILPLPLAPFRPLFDLSDAVLEARAMRRVVADAAPGFPCRVSLEDAAVGERLILLNFEHQPAATPYRASHAIYVREAAEEAMPAPGEIPPALARRLLSLRAFDNEGMMRGADVCEGAALASALEALFAEEAVVEIHIHNAKPGCYAARAVRA